MDPNPWSSTLACLQLALLRDGLWVVFICLVPERTPPPSPNSRLCILFGSCAQPHKATTCCLNSKQTEKWSAAFYCTYMGNFRQCHKGLVTK